MDKTAALKLMKDKNSQLCIGLDLRGENKLDDALELIDDTYDLAVAYKPNRQYWLGSSIDEMKQISSRIAKHRSFSIIDHKLSDIGSTNLAAFQHIAQEKFDMVTVSPFPGNLAQNYGYAKDLNIGLIALVLMSNPEALWMKNSNLYLHWAEESAKYAEGIVIGTTNHVTKESMARIKDLCLENFVLAPGLGSQGGNINDIKEIFGNKVLYTVSRGISNSKNKRESAENFYKLSIS